MVWFGSNATQIVTNRCYVNPTAVKIVECSQLHLNLEATGLRAHYIKPSAWLSQETSQGHPNKDSCRSSSLFLPSPVTVVPYNYMSFAVIAILFRRTHAEYSEHVQRKTAIAAFESVTTY